MKPGLEGDIDRPGFQVQEDQGDKDQEKEGPGRFKSWNFHVGFSILFKNRKGIAV